MTKICFLLSKDPVLEHGGDVELSRLLISVAAESFDVSAICLSAESGSVVADFVPGGLPLTRVAKPAVRPLTLAVNALRRRRSLVHVRFDSDALAAAIERSDADTFVAEHSYMAESFLRSTSFGKRALIVNTHVSEALVWGLPVACWAEWRLPDWCATSCGWRLPPTPSEPSTRRRPRTTARAEWPAPVGSG